MAKDLNRDQFIEGGFHSGAGTALQYDALVYENNDTDKRFTELLLSFAGRYGTSINTGSIGIRKNNNGTWDQTASADNSLFINSTGNNLGLFNRGVAQGVSAGQFRSIATNNMFTLGNQNFNFGLYSFFTFSDSITANDISIAIGDYISFLTDNITANTYTDVRTQNQLKSGGNIHIVGGSYLDGFTRLQVIYAYNEYIKAVLKADFRLIQDELVEIPGEEVVDEDKYNCVCVYRFGKKYCDVYRNDQRIVCDCRDIYIANTNFKGQ